MLIDGLPREVVAVTLDLAQLRCRHWDPWGKNKEATEELIDRSLEGRGDLDPDQRRRLVHLRGYVLQRFPENVFAEFGKLRRSFLAPVPNRIEERLA